MAWAPLQGRPSHGSGAVVRRHSDRSHIAVHRRRSRTFSTNGQVAILIGMFAEIRARMAQQHGLVTRRQAIESGLAAGHVDELVRRGTWYAVRRGVYAESVVWHSLDVRRDRPLLVARAVTLSAAKEHVWSHDTAALVLGIALRREPPSLTHVTRVGVHGSRTRSGVKHHRAGFRPEDVVEASGARCLTAARTAVDIGREHGFADALVACDQVLATGVARRQLLEAIDRMANWPGITAARAAVEIADGGAESVPESLTRGLIIRAGEPHVETQFGLRRGGRTVWCDLRVRRHVIEVDGKVKLRPVAAGGLAVDPTEALWAEKRRQDFVQSFRIGVSRVTWSEAQPDRWRETGARLLAEIAVTDRLFGTDLGDLAPYIVPSAWRRRGA